MKNHLKVFLLLSLATLLLPAACTIKLPDFTKIHPLREKKIDGSGKDKILIIEINGTLTQTDYLKNMQGKPKINIVARIKEELQLAEKDPDIKALLLLINSPGGEVTAADIIYHELEVFKSKRNLPIITSFGAMGASGAYYIAMTSNKIIAQPTSMVGSIGIIINSANLTGLMKKLGVEAVTYKSGEFKDMGSPFKPGEQTERVFFETIVNNLHQHFIKRVAEGRGLPVKDVAQLANGRIYTSEQALENGLIDEIGYIENAVALAKKEAGLLSATIIMYHRANEFRENVYNQNQSISNQVLGVDLDYLLYKSSSQLLYLWHLPMSHQAR